MSPYQLFVVALVATQAIAALSLNLLMGYAGQVSLGQAAFVGAGAYGAAQLAAWGVPFPFTLAGGAAVASVFAAIAGLPSLKIRGLQVAATTLAFGVVAERLLFARPWAEASTSGMIVPRPAMLASDGAFALAAIAALGGVVALDAAVRRGRFGRALYAVRDREDTAAAWGVPVGTVKLAAYATSGLYAGVAGGLYAYLLERVTPDPFTVWASLGLVAVVVVGGLGSWRGTLVAAAAFAGLPELLRPAARYAPLAGAVLLMLVPVLRPDGLGALLDRRRRRTDPLRPGTLGAAVRPPSLQVPIRTLLTARDVRVSFGGIEALRGVDLDVRRGEICGLIGPNGAGKSTFFDCVSGFTRPDAGTIVYRGRDLLAIPAHARTRIGIVRTFQHLGISRTLSVRDNVALAQHAIPRRLPVAPRSDAAIDILGLGDLRAEAVGGLPHGLQRMTEMAAAVAAGGDLLLLDEPAAGLTPEETDALAARILKLRDELGLTVLLIEHHVPLVARLCDRIWVLAEGTVIAGGTPEEIQRDPRVIAAYLAEAPEAVGA